MSGSVYPCGKCGEQNWVTDIDDNELCVKCREDKVVTKKWTITKTISYDVTAEIDLEFETEEQVVDWYWHSGEASVLEFEQIDGQDETIYIHEAGEVFGG